MAKMNQHHEGKAASSKTTEYKEGKAKVEVIYYRSKTLADGSHPFMVRISKDGFRKYISTGLSLAPKYWDEEKSRIKRGYPEPQREKLLQAIREWEDKYRESAASLAAADERHDARTVASKAIEERKATRRVTLLAYIDELATKMAKSGQVGNAGTYRDLRNQLRKFINDNYRLDDIPFERVSVAFCNDWETALRVTGAAETTLSNRFRTLRAVLNKAIANGVMKGEHYPFARTVAERHKFSIGKFDVSTVKRAVPREAIRRLEILTPQTERLKLAKDVFLFSFYCGGINFVDLAQLRWRNFTYDEPTALPQRLHYTRQKTGGKFSLKLLKPAVDIVSAYEELTRATSDSYVFPILDPVRHLTATQVKNRLHKVLGQVNKDLKDLADAAGIEVPLTTYVARHSFATSLKLEGIATGVIGQAMGHKSEAVTAIYLDSFASETMDAAFDVLL